MYHCFFAFFWAHLDIDDRTSGQIVSGLDVTCVLVNLQPTMGGLGADVCSRSGISWIRSNFQRVLFPSVFHKSSVLLSSKVSKYVFVCLTTSMYGVVATNKLPRHTPKISPCFHSVANNFRKVCNSAFFLRRVIPCAL